MPLQGGLDVYILTDSCVRAKKGGGAVLIRIWFMNFVGKEIDSIKGETGWETDGKQMETSGVLSWH